MVTKKSPQKNRAPKPTLIEIKSSNTVIQDIPKYFILGGLLIFMIAILWVIKPFMMPLIIGAVIATGFNPLQERIKLKIPNRTLSALLGFFIILVIIMVPVSWFISYITQQAIETYLFIESKVSELLAIDVTLIPKIIKNSFVGPYLLQVEEYLPQPTEIAGFVTDMIKNLSQFLVNQSTNFAKQLSVLAFHIFVLLLSIFFFLRDGDRVVGEIKELMPLAHKYKEEVFSKLKDMSRGILYGVFGGAIAQGFLGGVGMAIVGIENAAFWGTLMSFSALVPFVGPMLIWVPAAITLFVTQHWIAGLVLTLWGIFVVGTVDNIIKPILIGEKAQIHPLMSFLTILGGIFTMGLPGLIVAPYLLSLALTFLHIYKLEYKSILDR
ncbi:MAG: hypothetical protein UW70_C0019G0015 [Candidatus Peregrinibacteria bacterium GW2011_GWA2_44_7]|nr:MAG: hypothetical protein UW70_C0019G0015 [Candidatus Peregrinibacteria bacterium GW2011_GWA2_44_7]